MTKEPRQRGSRRAVVITAIVLLACLVAWGSRNVLTAVRLFSIDQGDTASIPFAVKSLQSNSSLVRRAAARGLGQIGPEAKVVVPQLLEALHDERWEVASDAAWSLGIIESAEPKVVDSLVVALKHDHREVRRYAAFALARLGANARSAIPELTRCLDDDDMGYMAARALGDIGGDARNAIPSLTKLLASPSLGDRAEAAKALANLGPLPPDTVEALKRLEDDEVDVVQRAASNALKGIRQSNTP